MPKYKVAVIIFFIILFTGLFTSHKYRVSTRKYGDFNCFYITGQRMLAHQDIYVLRDQETAEFRYTPVFALLMSGLALLSQSAADTVWFSVNFILCILMFVLLKRMLVREAVLSYRDIFLLYLLGLLGTFRFILHNLDSGQSNILMLASMIAGLYYASKKRELLGAAFFAFSIMIKYTPIIFLPYFILKRKFKLTGAIICFMVVYFLLPGVFIGMKSNLQYVKDWVPFLTQSTILDETTILDSRNQSLLSLCQRSFTLGCKKYWVDSPAMPFESFNLNQAQIKLIFIFLAVILYGLSVLKYRKKNDKKDTPFCCYVDYGLLSICVVLFNLNAWKPTFIFLLFAYMVICYYLIKTGFKEKLLIFLLGASYLLNISTMYSIFGKAFTNKLYFYSPLTLSALLVFIALVRIKFVQYRENYNLYKR